MPNFPDPKDPDAVLDYHSDWTDWLGSATITGHQVTVTGATLDSSAAASGVVSMWISGGVAGQDAYIHVQVTASDGRIDERTHRLNIRER